MDFSYETRELDSWTEFSHLTNIWRGTVIEAEFGFL